MHKSTSDKLDYVNLQDAKSDVHISIHNCNRFAALQAFYFMCIQYVNCLQIANGGVHESIHKKTFTYYVYDSAQMIIQI